MLFTTYFVCSQFLVIKSVGDSAQDPDLANKRRSFLQSKVSDPRPGKDSHGSRTASSGQYLPLRVSTTRPKLATRVERLLSSKPAVQIEDLGNSDGPLSAKSGRVAERRYGRTCRSSD